VGLGFGATPVQYSAKFLFASENNQFESFQVDPGFGTLTSSGTTTKALGAGTYGLAVHPSGEAVYEVEYSGPFPGIVYQVSYSVDPSIGTLSFLNDFAGSANQYLCDGYLPAPPAVEPSGRWGYEFYIANPASSCSGPWAYYLNQYTLSNSGALSQLIPRLWSPYEDLVVDPTGRLQFNYTGSYLNWGMIDPSSGNISFSSSLIITPVGNGFLALDPRGRFLYFMPQNPQSAPGIYVYSISAIDGSLTQIGFQYSDILGGPLAIDPTGRFLYTAALGLSNASTLLSSYSIDVVGGGLTQIFSDITLGGPNMNITDMKIDPSGKFLFLSDSASNTIIVYGIDQTTGALKTVIGSPFASNNNVDGLGVSGTIQ